ncbi:nocturnin isoform X2 [Planococcus citri]
MGSFTSAHIYNNDDHEDNDIELPKSMNGDDLLAIFENDTATNALQLQREFLRVNDKASDIRVMQWNVLSQTIGQHYDKFVNTPRRALEWKHRRFYILQEMITYMPDIFCLQEVDHFEFLCRTLSTQGYAGIFCPKPDSPCLHVKDNNGPDGCAIFYLKERFDVIKTKKKVLPVWTISSNQVAIIIQLHDNWSNKDICVVTTHLKARPGALMSSIRKEQGRALMECVSAYSDQCPLLICGDFNAEPTEAVYDVMCSSTSNLGSAYALDGKEPSYTTWKIREEGEQCQTLDYIFYTKNKLRVDAILEFPNDGQIGENRLPSLVYPSDHLSLVCDISYV